MNSPQSLLSSATFNSLTNFFLNPAARRMRIYSVKETAWPPNLHQRYWQAGLTMQYINLCGTAVPNICFATGPCLSRIGSIWRKSISYLERSSSQVPLKKQQSGIFKLLTSAKKLKDCNHLPRIVIRIQNECGGTDALYQLSRKETLEQRHVSKWI